MLPTNEKATSVFLFKIKASHVTTEVTSLLSQIKSRRKALGLKQSDMMLRVGMSRQQFQRLEAQGNPRLNTLEHIALGLNCTGIAGTGIAGIGVRSQASGSGLAK